MNTRLAVVGLLIAAQAMGCTVSREIGARSFHLLTQLWPSPMERRTLPMKIESACSRGSITWIVPVSGDEDGDGDVVLVDTGFDDQARSIKAKVGGRRVVAILLTHGHLDHAAGASAIDAPVYVGAADAPALRGEATFTALYPRLGEALAGIPRAMGPVVEVKDGESFTFGRHTFTAIATPGHTHGSISWLLGDVLFGGDAIQSPLADEVFPAPAGYTLDLRAAYQSIRRLRDVDVAYLADAHYGVLKDPAAAFSAAVVRDHDDVSRLSYPGLRPVGCGDDLVSW